MTYSHVCPFCEEGAAHEVVYSDHVKLGRRLVLIDGLRKTVCDLCGSETVPDELHDANLALVQHAGETCRGAVSEGMLRKFRETWHLTQKDASLLFGAGKSSFAKWEAKQSKLSTPTALLLQAAIHVPGVVPYLAKLANFALPESSKGLKACADVAKISGAYESICISTEEASNGVLMASKVSNRISVRRIRPDIPRDVEWSTTVVSSGGEVRELRTLLEAA